MNTISDHLQKLEPMTIEQRIYVALAATRFFSPMLYEVNCAAIGITPEPNTTRPLCGLDFMKYLKTTNALPLALLPEPGRHYQRIDELLRRLAHVGLLSDLGSSKSPLLGNHYYAMSQFTKLQRTGVLCLARALGPSLLHWVYQNGTYQITGVSEGGDEHAGTAIAIAPRWLMTCAHVVADMKVNKHQSQPGREFSVLRQVVHDIVDVALIEVDRDVQVVQGLNFRDPHIAERVYTFGYPRVPLSTDAVLVMQGGEVSAEQVTSFTKECLFLFSAIARPGNSGGPILSGEGHVVGIVTKELSESDPLKQQPFHAGISASTLYRAIQELGCPVSLPIETWE